MQGIVLRLVIALLGAASLAACGGSKPSRFYMLTPLQVLADESGVIAEHALIVGIEPPTFAEYLRRPQIVSRGDGAQLHLAEFDRWGEPIEANFGSVLKMNLAALIPQKAWLIYPWHTRPEVDYRISIEVTRFDLEARKRVVLHVEWRVLKGATDEFVIRKISRLDRDVDLTQTKENEVYTVVVSAMSELVAELSRDMAQSIVGSRSSP